MEWQDVRDAIVAKLQTITGIGNVYGYPLDLTDPNTLANLAYQPQPDGTKRLNVWIVERRAARDIRGGERRDVPLSGRKRLDTWGIVGYVGFRGTGGASIEEFNDLVERIMDAFFPDPSLGQADCTWYAHPLSCRLYYTTLADVLCHVVDIELVVERMVHGGVYS